MNERNSHEIMSFRICSRTKQKFISLMKNEIQYLRVNECACTIYHTTAVIFILLSVFEICSPNMNMYDIYIYIYMYAGRRHNLE